MGTVTQEQLHELLTAYKKGLLETKLEDMSNDKLVAFYKAVQAEIKKLHERKRAIQKKIRELEGILHIVQRDYQKVSEDVKYLSSSLMKMFDAVYTLPRQAALKCSEFEEKHGIRAAQKKLAHSPASFGKLKRKSWLGGSYARIFKDGAYEDFRNILRDRTILMQKIKTVLEPKEG